MYFGPKQGTHLRLTQNKRVLRNQAGNLTGAGGVQGRSPASEPLWNIQKLDCLFPGSMKVLPSFDERESRVPLDGLYPFFLQNS